jgi:hypothetical protein
MITSNAGAEFSTKTTIIVALARQPPENAVDQTVPPLFCAAGGRFPIRLN